MSYRIWHMSLGIPPPPIHKRLPSLSPIVTLRSGEVLLVIVNGRLAVSVARIVIPATEFARIANRFEHRKNAQAAFRFRRLEHRVNGRSGAAADVQEAGGEEPVAFVDTDLPVEARLDRRLFGKEVVDRIWNVLFEPFAMAIEQPLLDRVYGRVANDDFEVTISGQSAFLAARRGEFRQNNAQRNNCANAAPVRRGRITKEVFSEMTPAERPQRIHLLGRRPRAHKILIDEAHLKPEQIIA